MQVEPEGNPLPTFKNQWSLNLLAISALKHGNVCWAQQLFMKGIESEPTCSVGYLGQVIVGLHLIKANIELHDALHHEDPDQNFYLMVQAQRALQLKIESYLRYVATLENQAFSKLLQTIAKHLIVGSTMNEGETNVIQ
jgi:hypothetical protein